MLLQACVNGGLSKADHPAVPVTAEEVAADALACVEASAGSIHFHPRDANGVESVEAAIVDHAAHVVRSACGVPVCVSTGAWIEPDITRRAESIRGWRTRNLGRWT